MRKLIIIGASGHGKVVADIALRVGYGDVRFLDDAEGRSECAGLPIVGSSADVERIAEAAEYFVAIGNAAVRARILDSLSSQGLSVATLVHPQACISRRVVIGEGTVIMAGAVVNSDTQIGRGCIVNTGATVDHDCRIADFVHVSVGAHLAGMVAIGVRTWIGAGAVVSNNINICSDCMIGAGTVVVSNINERGTYVGVPARLIQPWKASMGGGST